MPKLKKKCTSGFYPFLNGNALSNVLINKNCATYIIYWLFSYLNDIVNVYSFYDDLSKTMYLVDDMGNAKKRMYVHKVLLQVL